MTRALLAVLAAFTQAPEPPPLAPGRQVVLERVSGRVLVKGQGARYYLPLRAPRRVADGTSVDARGGRVRLIAGRGGRDRAEFFDGKFDVERSGGVTTLTLTGSSFEEVCGKPATARAAGRGRVRRLWGDGKGRFRTRGRYSAATVRGTRWLTEDLCDGTLTRVSRGEVEVEDFTERVPRPGGGGGGGGPVTGGGEDDGGATPAPRPGPRRVTVGRGDAYVARPGG